MKLDLESIFVFFGFFLLSASLYLYLCYECNLGDTEIQNIENLEGDIDS
jgi:hypothetical protein